MKVKVCSNDLCDISKSATTFNADENTCPYCNQVLKLRNPDYDLDDASLEKYEGYVNSLFESNSTQINSPLDFTKYYSFIGNEWFNRENWDKSLLYIKKALDLLMNIEGDHRKGIETLHDNLGNVYMKIEQPDQAVENYTKCLEIQKEYVDRQSLVIGWTFNNLANAYFSQGNYEKSIENFKKAIEICEISSPEDYDSLITLYRCLGHAYFLKPDWSEAIFYLEKALSFCDNSLDPENHRRLLLVSMIGEAYASISDFNKAVYYFEKELFFTSGLYNDIKIPYIYWKLGNSYKQSGKYSLAIKTYQEGFNKLEIKAGGFPHKIGQCFEALNKLDKALEYYRSASEIRMNALGMDEKETIEAINDHNRLAATLGKSLLDTNLTRKNNNISNRIRAFWRRRKL